MIRGLKHFQFRGTDVIVFHVLDPDELEFPFERATRFEDIGDAATKSWPCRRSCATHYLEAMQALIDRYKRELGAARASTTTCSRTDQPLELALLAYLSTGEGFLTRRSIALELMSFLSPLFLARRAGGGRADRAAPAEARAGSARASSRRCKLLRRAPVEHARAAASARTAAAGPAGGGAAAAGLRVRATVPRVERCAQSPA